MEKFLYSLYCGFSDDGSVYRNHHDWPFGSNFVDSFGSNCRIQGSHFDCSFAIQRASLEVVPNDCLVSLEVKKQISKSSGISCLLLVTSCTEKV